MIKKYDITVNKGKKAGFKSSVSMKDLDPQGNPIFPTEESIDSWFNEESNRGTFGEPERDYVYKIEYYKETPSGNRVLHMTKEFPLDLEYDEDIITMGDHEEQRPGMIHKKFTYRLKQEYTVVTSDIEADLLAAETEKIAEETAKQECCDRLANIDWSSKTTIASLKPILQDIIEHLGIEPSE